MCLAAMIAGMMVAAAGVVCAAVFPGSFRGFVFGGFGLAVGLVEASAATVAEEAIAAGTLGLGLGKVAWLGVGALIREGARCGVGLSVCAVGLRVGALIEAVVLGCLPELGCWLAKGLLAGVIGCWTTVGRVAVEAGAVSAPWTVVGLRTRGHGWLRAVVPVCWLGGTGVVAGLLIGAVGSFVAAVRKFTSTVWRFVAAVGRLIVAIGAVLAVVGAVSLGWAGVVAAAIVGVHGTGGGATLWAAATG